jgi:Zn-dependent M28 family amino/carboxypeptidase
VLVMAHWDHFGQCGTPPRLCPGAVDNASGVAVITEVARSLVRGRRAAPMDRDVYFLATTGEELGLLGAMAFAENPPLPLDKVVAAFNVDSTGLVPAGRPVAIVGGA